MTARKPPEPLDPNRRVTIRDVAESADVSRSTASRALTGRGYVAPTVRERVRAAAHQLGYVPDATAQHLRQKSGNSIGVLVSDLRNDFYASLAAGISQQARTLQYTTILTDDGGLPAVEAEAAEAFVALRVAGVIVTPASEQVADYLGRHRIPVVEVDRQFAAGKCDAVVVDNRGSARELTSDLVALGHRRIALMIYETRWTTALDRLAGYEDALRAAGVPSDPSLVITSGWNVADARVAAYRVLAAPNRPSAIFAANNVLAEGAWRAAADLGLVVPDDLSLVCFDDVPWMSMVRPGVTAVGQDAVALGAAAVNALLERLASPAAPVRTVMLTAAITRRGSTAPPRSKT